MLPTGNALRLPAQIELGGLWLAVAENDPERERLRGVAAAFAGLLGVSAFPPILLRHRIRPGGGRAELEAVVEDYVVESGEVDPLHILECFNSRLV